MKKQVNVGRDLGKVIFSTSDRVTVKEVRETTRTFIARFIVTGVAVAMVITGGIDLYKGSFNEFQTVWNVSSGILGAVLGFYFGTNGGSGG